MKFEQKISCIIPAFNEAKNIGRVLGVLEKIGWIDEIVVVDDGSTDQTAQVANSFKISNFRVISHDRNLGKGAAMATGIRATKYDLVFFIDSDLVGLEESHILKILAPIIFTKEADLCLGVFALKKLNYNTTTKVANRMFPAITGQRAVWRNLLPPLSQIERSRYGVDLLITKNIPRRHRAVVKLNNLAQVKKEQKSDIVINVVKARIKMYQEISKAMNSNDY